MSKIYVRDIGGGEVIIYITQWEYLETFAGFKIERKG